VSTTNIPDGDVRTDFEGMTGIEDMVNEIDYIRICASLEGTESDRRAAELTFHWCYAEVDQGGQHPTREAVQDVFWGIRMVLEGNAFMTSGIDWNEPAYTPPSSDARDHPSEAG